MIFLHTEKEPVHDYVRQALFLSWLFSVWQNNISFRHGKEAAVFVLPYTILNEMTVMIVDICEVLSYVTLYK